MYTEADRSATNRLAYDTFIIGDFGLGVQIKMKITEQYERRSR